jgi:hypothetical protein
LSSHRRPHGHYRRSAERAQIAVNRERVVRKTGRRSAVSFTRRADSRPSARLIHFDEYVVALGVLSADQRERLSRTHVEYGASPIGGVAWFPKETPDAA